MHDELERREPTARPRDHSVLSQRRGRCLAGLALATSLLGAPSCRTTPSVDLAIVGATLIDGTGAAPRSNTTILVRDGHVVDVVAGETSFRAETVVDAAGKFATPGFANMHVHFATGAPRPRDENTTDDVLGRLLFYGVTSILQLGGSDASTDTINELRARHARGALAAPTIYGTGGHLTLDGTHPVHTIFPPPVREAADAIVAATPEGEPANLYPIGVGLSIVRTEQAARLAVRERAAGGMDAIKITVESGPTTFGDDHPQMSVEMVRAIVDEAREHGLRVFAHVTSLDELEAVLDGGAAGAVHAVWDRPLPDAALADRMAEAGFVVVPTLALFHGAIALRYIDEPVDLDDPFLRLTLTNAEAVAIGSAGFLRNFRERGAIESEPGVAPSETLRRHLEELRANVALLHARGVPIVVGTDTGNPTVFAGFDVHLELELLVLAGLTPMEALECATRRAAEMIGVGDEFGTIERGKRADVLLFGASPLEDIRNTRTLETVIAEGRVVDRDAILRSNGAKPASDAPVR